jgi:hypothetical protein
MAHMQVKLLSLTLGSLAVSRSSFRELHAALGHGFNPLNLLWMPENGKPERKAGTALFPRKGAGMCKL